LGAFPIPAELSISRVQESFDDEGNPSDPSYEKRAENFISTLLWFTEATTTQKEKDQVNSSTS